MNVSAPFIRRPVMTTLLMVFITGVGLLGYQALPVSDLPNVDFPTIQVTAPLPGANPETMASAVATPLEKQFTAIPGLDRDEFRQQLRGRRRSPCSSTSTGTSTRPPWTCSRPSRRRPGCCPPDMPTPPSFRKVNPADSPILILALTSDTLPLYEVNEYAETFLAQRLSMVSGVAQVIVFGEQKQAVRVQVDPDLLAARRIGIDEVSDALREANVNLPTGTFQGEQQAFNIQSTGQLDERGRVPPGDRRVPQRQPGPARRPCPRGRRRRERQGRRAGSPSGTGRQAARPRAVGRAGRPEAAGGEHGRGGRGSERLDSRRSRHSSRRRSSWPSSPTGPTPIRESIDDVQITLLVAFVLVVLVIFLFLRSVRATLIPSLALPVSVVATFGVMYLLGYTLNNLSLLALTLAVGFVVDDAIVMLENIVRHLDMGKDRVAGGPRRVGRGRVHHRVDDRLAGRGVHPGAVPGRDRRPAAAGVRGHHLGGHHRLRARVGHAHADALCPARCGHGHGGGRHGCAVPRDRARLRPDARGLRPHPAAGRCGSSS